MKKTVKMLFFLILSLTWKLGLAQSDYSSVFSLDCKTANSKNIRLSEHLLSPYSLDLTRELVLYGAGGAMTTSGLILIHNLDPLTAERIAELDPKDVNGFDRGAIGVQRKSYDGDTLAFASLLLPLTLLTYEETRRDFGLLTVMATEVILLNQGINLMAKGLTRRVRPYVYDPETPYEEKIKKKARLSFYSGHTSNAAAMTFFTAMVFSDYLTNKTEKIVIWTAAAMYPALVGFLRMDSSYHFPSDVIVGYCVGAAIGLAIPLLHNKKNKNLSLHPEISRGYIRVALNYSF